MPSGDYTCDGGGGYVGELGQEPPGGIAYPGGVTALGGPQVVLPDFNFDPTGLAGDLLAQREIFDANVAAIEAAFNALAPNQQLVALDVLENLDYSELTGFLIPAVVTTLGGTQFFLGTELPPPAGCSGGAGGTGAVGDYLVPLTKEDCQITVSNRSQLNSAVNSGKVVCLTPGDYSGGTLTLSGNGTTLYAPDGGVTFRRNSAGAIIKTTGNNNVISGIELIGGGGGGGALNMEGNGNVFQNGIIRDTVRYSGAGGDSHCVKVSSKDAQNNRIVNNEIFNCKGDNIQVGSGGANNSGTVIAGNTLYNHAEQAIDFKGFATNDNPIIVTGNDLSLGTRQPGGGASAPSSPLLIFTRGGHTMSNYIITNNNFSDGLAGVYACGGNGNAMVSNVTISNNTFSDLSRFGIGCIRDTSNWKVTDNKFTNVSPAFDQADRIKGTISNNGPNAPGSSVPAQVQASCDNAAGGGSGGGSGGSGSSAGVGKTCQGAVSQFAKDRPPCQINVSNNSQLKSAVKSGKSVCVKPGNYTGAGFLKISSNTFIQATGPGVIFPNLRMDGSNIVVDGVEIKGGGGGSGQVDIRGSNNTLQNSYLHDTKISKGSDVHCVKAWGSGGHTIVNNHIENCAGDNIQVGDTNTPQMGGTVIAGNTLIGHSENAIDFKTSGTSGNPILITGNLIQGGKYGFDGSGWHRDALIMYTQMGTDMKHFIIENNHIKGSKQGLVSCGGTPANGKKTDVTNVTVRNNHFDNLDNGIACFDPDARNWSITNNTFNNVDNNIVGNPSSSTVSGNNNGGTLPSVGQDCSN